MSKERLEEIKEQFAYCMDNGLLFADQEEKLLDELYKQTERVQKLEIYVDENSKKHANLNVFLQERNTTSTLGMHVVDAIMKYVQELETKLKKEKKEHKKTRRHFNGHRRKTSENWRTQRATQNRNSQLENVLEQFRDQNKRYREALEVLVKRETLGRDVETGKTAVSYNGMIALKGLGSFDEDKYIIYGLGEITTRDLEELK